MSNFLTNKDALVGDIIWDKVVTKIGWRESCKDGEPDLATAFNYMSFTFALEAVELIKNNKMTIDEFYTKENELIIMYEILMA